MGHDQYLPFVPYASTDVDRRGAPRWRFVDVHSVRPAMGCPPPREGGGVRPLRGEPTVNLVTAVETSTEVRWRRWQARASQQDHRRETWSRVVMALLFLAFGGWLLVQLVAF